MSANPQDQKPTENPLAAWMGIWTARIVFYGSKILFPVGGILVIARWNGGISGPWWLVSLPLIVGIALIAVIVVTMAAAILGHKRAYKWGPGISPRADAESPEVLMEVRDNRQDRNLLRAWDADGRELTPVERLLVGKPPGMGTGSCANPAHASKHPPHVETDAILGEYWCVGGWVRTDGTIPGRS